MKAKLIKAGALGAFCGLITALTMIGAYNHVIDGFIMFSILLFEVCFLIVVYTKREGERDDAI